MKILSTQYSTMMIFALIVSVGLILSTTVVSANAEVQKKIDVKVQQKKDTKHVTVVKKTVKKTETKTAPKPAAPAPAPVTTPAPVDPLQEKLDACKTKETPREQYECQKAAKAGAGGSEFKAKATATKIGPVTFYYAGAKVESSGGKDIVNLRFLVENTGSNDNISMLCTGPIACNYDISDGTTTFKYAANDFTNGNIVLKPGNSRMMNILFGPAIGYGSYIDFKYDSSKQYTFNVHEPWGSGSIPLNLK
jgi:cytoskeletal protein RodZ